MATYTSLSGLSCFCGEQGEIYPHTIALCVLFSFILVSSSIEAAFASHQLLSGISLALAFSSSCGLSTPS